MDAEDRRARREARRRAVRRRRLTAVAAVVLVGVAVGAVALASGGSSHGGGGRTPDAASSGAAAPTTATASHAAPAPSGSSTGGGSTGATPRATAVPILMYHVIAAPPAGAPFPGLYVPAAEFAEQMQALQRAGWHAVTMDQLQAHWRTGASLGPGRPIVLTFDNGYNSQYTHALPVLRKLGWVGVENIQLSGLPPSQGGLGEGQVRGLLAAGWELDTQGISHADLTALGPAALHYQVAVARTLLQHRYHVPVNWFCYPSGHYDAAVVATVQATGYVGSTTVVPGWAHPGDDPYRLHRLRVLGGTSGSQLLAQVASTRGEGPAPPTYTGG
jgi:peptidoglycan/xylan/chitin deacetylase (PgdA/CDA1 family)